MLQQVQLSDEEMLRILVKDSGSLEIIRVMKAYVLGYLGIPIAQCSRIMETIDIYQEWLESGMISTDNIINIFYNSATKISNFHNKRRSSEDYNQAQEIFRDHIEFYVQRVLENQRYFDDGNVAYNPKEEIMMSLNFTENECSICTTNMDPESVVILDCTHVYHFECLYSHVKNSIQNGILSVKCPSQYCGIELSNHEIENFMEGELHRKYEDYMMNQYVQRNGANTSWCPTPGCQALFQADAQVTVYDCKNCGQRYCLKCRCQYHDGMTCKEYLEYTGMNPEDRSFIDFAKGARFKQCPRCRFWVQRNQGCPTMKCRCSQQFCYECGGVTCPHGRCSKKNTTNLPSRGLQHH